MTKEDIIDFFVNEKHKVINSNDSLYLEILDAVRKAYSAHVIALSEIGAQPLDPVFEVSSLANASIHRLNLGNFVVDQIRVPTLRGTEVILVQELLEEIPGNSIINHKISNLDIEMNELMDKMGQVQERADIIKKEWEKCINHVNGKRKEIE